MREKILTTVITLAPLIALAWAILPTLHTLLTILKRRRKGTSTPSPRCKLKEKN